MMLSVLLVIAHKGEVAAVVDGAHSLFAHLQAFVEKGFAAFHIKTAIDDGVFGHPFADVGFVDGLVEGLGIAVVDGPDNPYGECADMLLVQGVRRFGSGGWGIAASGSELNKNG